VRQMADHSTPEPAKAATIADLRAERAGLTPHVIIWGNDKKEVDAYR
jgi:hypothetical protein